MDLQKLSNGSQKSFLVLFWLSPISLLATYANGFNDIIPVSLLLFGLYAIKVRRFLFSGILIALAISCKLSMMIALPLIFLYFYNNPNLREFGTRFLLPFTICLVFISLPFILSKDAWTMLFSSSELKQFANISIFFAGESISAYAVGLPFFLYWLWRIRRFNLRCCYPLLVYRSLQSPCLFSTLLAGLCGACHSWSYIKIKRSRWLPSLAMFTCSYISRMS